MTTEYPIEWYPKADFARQIDAARWRELRLTPVEPGKAYREQVVKLPSGDEAAAARIVVSALVVHFLATGERINVRLRCRDVLPSGRKVLIDFSSFGFSIGSCEDDYTSPTLGLAAVTGAVVRRKK